MTYLEVRRHSTRRAGTEHLSQEGVNLARRLGTNLGPFARVIASPVAWSQQTALAMGFAIDEIYTPVEFTTEEWRDLDAITPPSTSLGDRSRAMREDPLGRRYAEALLAQWSAIAETLPKDATALVVSHGGYTDSIAVACAPNVDETWGPAIRHCEGVRLAWDGSRFVSGEVLRVNPA